MLADTSEQKDRVFLILTSVWLFTALFLFGNPDTGQARLVAALDNLGKGAAGAAVQNLNILAGLPETAGLRL